MRTIYASVCSEEVQVNRICKTIGKLQASMLCPQTCVIRKTPHKIEIWTNSSCEDQPDLDEPSKPRTSVLRLRLHHLRLWFATLTAASFGGAFEATRSSADDTNATRKIKYAHSAIRDLG